MTSLSEQLKRLAVPQTSILRQDKKKPSLLFDPKEAAGLKKETVYQIGLDGLDGLKCKNPNFAQFENNLFHPTSKEFERAVQTKEANEKLNKQISSFLFQLSPYFMLYDSYKALEWLINRYRIHEYNKEDFLMLILPYHETNIFVRALQLVNLKNPGDKWYWLQTLQKPGIHLPKDTLYNHAANDPYFLKVLSEYILKISKEHENPAYLTVIFNFYCATFVGAINHSKTINEGHVSQILLSLMKGLKSEIPDFCASSYIIAARLVAKTDLSEKLLLKLVDKVTIFPVGILKKEAAALLVIIYQFQKEFKMISVNSIQKISEASWMTKIFQEFDKNGMHIYPFLEPLFKEAIKLGMSNGENDNVRKFIINLLNDLKLNEDFVSILIGMVLDTHHHKTKYPHEVSVWLKQLMDVLERQYPSAFDKAINSIMKYNPGQKLNKKQKSVQKILKTSIDNQSSFGLYEKLFSPLSNVRKDTISHMCKNYNSLKQREQDLLQTVLLQRLLDDNYETAYETFRASMKCIEKVLDTEEVINICTTFLSKAQTHKDVWWKISYNAANVLIRVCDGSDIKVFLSFLPFLLPTAEDEFRAAKLIVNSSYGEKCHYLKSNVNNLRSAPSYYKFFTIVFDGLSLNENLPDIKDVLCALKTFPAENRNALHKYIATLLLSSTLPANCPADIASGILDILLIYLDSSKLKPVKKEANVSTYITMARNNKFPLEGFLECLETLFLKTQVPNKPLGYLDFYINNEISKFYLVLLNILVNGSFSKKKDTVLKYNESLKKFFECFADSLPLQIDAYLNVVTSESKYVDSQLQLRCLTKVNQLLGEEVIDLTNCLNLKNLTVPYLLVTLCNNEKEIREAALSALKILSMLGNRNVDNYLPLVQNLMECQEEIMLDAEQLPIIIQNVKEKGSNKAKSILNIMSNLTMKENVPLCLTSGLNKVLSLVNDINTLSATVTYCINYLQKLENVEELNSQYSTIVYLNIMKLKGDVASDIKLDDKVWSFVQLCINNQKIFISYNDSKLNVTVLTLQQVNREFFANLKSPVQKSLLDCIINLAADSPTPDVLTAANHVVKKIDLDAKLIIDHLAKMRDVQSPKLSDGKRKRRITIIPTPDILDTIDWKKGVTVLEFIHGKKNFRNAELLLPVLFDLLKKCLDFDEQNIVEYVKLLILTNISYCCEKANNLPDKAFNVELVAKCMTASKNPQTHREALLLLTQATSIVPEQVLLPLMNNFTFVGSPVLRHDDAYSTQINFKIVDTIIPLLVQDGDVKNISEVLSVFVGAILDVPEHRRIPLYKQLLTNIDPNKNLHIFLLLIFEAHVLHGNTEKQNNSSANTGVVDSKPKRLDIAADLCREFSPEVNIFNCIKLIKYCHEYLKVDRTNVNQKMSQLSLFEIKNRTPQQFRHYKYTILLFIKNLLSSKEFILQVAELPDDQMNKLEKLFRDAIVNNVMFIQDIAKVSEKNANTAQAKYWKVMLDFSYDILDSVNALLTHQMFLLVIRGLMKHELQTVKRRAIELLNSKLQHDHAFFNSCSETELMELLTPIEEIVKSAKSTEISQEHILIVQNALLSLNILSKTLIENNAEKFVEILELVTDMIKSANHSNILASLILSLAELCTNLRAYAIPSLHKFMPSLLKMLKSQKAQETPDLLLLCAVTAVEKILDSLAQFLSPYLEKLLIEVANLFTFFQVEANEKKLGTFATKLISIKQKLGLQISIRVLIPAVEKSYNSLKRKGSFKCIGPLMGILSENIANLNNAEIQANLPDLTTFFLNILDFRVEEKVSMDDANEVEKHIIKALTTLVLKLSETTFRPLYYKLYDWVRSDVKSERVITFYSLSSGIAHKLKGLFVLFAGYFLNNAASLLDACNALKKETLYFDDTQRNILLLEYVLKTLNAIFMYDTHKFINKDRFDVLMQPVVDQIENVLGGEEISVQRAKDLVVPCIVNLAVATADDALWKQMNYQILLKMRHTSPFIRLIALDSLIETAKKLGEDFLPLLPETIPFLAELLEDEDEKVEQAARKAVQELEKVVGEPLEKYF